MGGSQSGVDIRAGHGLLGHGPAEQREHRVFRSIATDPKVVQPTISDMSAVTFGCSLYTIHSAYRLPRNDSLSAL